MSGERVLPDEGYVLIELTVTFPHGQVIQRRVLAAEYDLTIEQDHLGRLAGYPGRVIPGPERIRLNALVEKQL